MSNIITTEIRLQEKLKVKLKLFLIFCQHTKRSFQNKLKIQFRESCKEYEYFLNAIFRSSVFSRKKVIENSERFGNIPIALRNKFETVEIKVEIFCLKEFTKNTMRYIHLYVQKKKYDRKLNHTSSLFLVHLFSKFAYNCCPAEKIDKEIKLKIYLKFYFRYCIINKFRRKNSNIKKINK